MSQASGQMLSHYRLEERIGEGGMGVVWRGTDTTLGRAVAIKILPKSLSEDPVHLARFEREAKLLASLNHPGIAVIHGLHHAEGIHFLAMELVPGENLARRLERGALPVGEAIEVSARVAEALEAAHESGVVHRDLKPANIQLTPDGKVKVLDFGLAKALDPDSGSTGSASMSPTMTAAATRAGIILGTAAYMSPEQARGRSVDKRADIWAYGCVLYEMLTRRRLFEGETVSDTLAAVLKTEPDWAELPAETPRAVERLLRRCLTKDPKARLRDIGEARVALAEVMSGTGEGTIDSPGPSPGAGARGVRPIHLVLWAGSLILTAAAAGWIGWSSRRPPAIRVPLRKFSLSVPVGKHSFGDSADPILSPDGRMLAYGAEGGIWIWELDHLTPRKLLPAEKTYALFWSPDSAYLGYLSDGKLWKVPARGGEPSAVCAVEGNFSEIAGGAWQEDGRILLTTGYSGLLQVAAIGGDISTALPLTPDESDFHDVSPIPGGGVLFTVHRKTGGIDTLATFGKSGRKDLIRFAGQTVGSPMYSPTGHILFERYPTNPGIWAVPFSLSELKVTGPPFLVASGGGLPSASGEGTLAYVEEKRVGLSQLFWVDRTGKKLGTVGPPAQQGPFPRISPDRRHVITNLEEGSVGDLWLLDLARNTQRRLTSTPENEFVPVWSPRGDRILFVRGTDPANFVMFLIPADGSAPPEEVGPGVAASFSPDGKWIAYAGSGDGGLDLFAMPLEGDRKRVPIVHSKAFEGSAQISPNGDLLAYQSNESGRDEIYLTRFPDGKGKWQVSADGGNWPLWNGRGDRLYYAHEDDLIEVSVASRPEVTLGAPQKLFTRPTMQSNLPFGWPVGFDVAQDGQRFLVLESVGPATGEAKIAVVENWFEEFRTR